MGSGLRALWLQDQGLRAKLADGAGLSPRLRLVLAHILWCPKQWGHLAQECVLYGQYEKGTKHASFRAQQVSTLSSSTGSHPRGSTFEGKAQEWGFPTGTPGEGTAGEGGAWL